MFSRPHKEILNGRILASAQSIIPGTYPVLDSTTIFISQKSLWLSTKGYVGVKSNGSSARIFFKFSVKRKGKLRERKSNFCWKSWWMAWTISKDFVCLFFYDVRRICSRDQPCIKVVPSSTYLAKPTTMLDRCDAASDDGSTERYRAWA